MSLLNLSRISTLTSLRRLPAVTKCIPVSTRTIVSTQPLLNSKNDSAFKIEKMLLPTILYKVLPNSLGNMVSNKLILQKIQKFLKLVFPFLLSRSEEIHKLILPELNANQMTKEYFGSFNLSKEARVKFVANENFSKSTSLEITNTNKNSTSIKTKQKKFEIKFKLAVMFPVVGMKNSGLALAIFDLDTLLKNEPYLRIERIILNLNSPGNLDIDEFAIKTNLYFAK